MKFKKLKTYLILFGGLTIVMTLLPFVAVDYWWIRVFDFPHLQITILSFISLIVYFFRFNFKSFTDYAFITALSVCCFYQFSKIYSYTFLTKTELKTSSIPDEQGLKLFTSNVLQSNDSTILLLKEIERFDPDIILLTETDQKWVNGISSDLSTAYPYKVEYPLSNTYGMILYSRYKLVNPKVMFMVDDSIPSIHTKLLLTANDTVQLYGIHPTPPMPQHNPMSTDRDAELMKIALLSMESRFPVIVLGDFNDVPWSQSIQKFSAISGLLDPRIGRGMLNTYHAQNPLLRWPLDHIFVSEHFRFIDMERGKNIQSDHFPMMVRLAFKPENSHNQKKKPPSASLLKEAQNSIKKEKKQDKKNT